MYPLNWNKKNTWNDFVINNVASEIVQEGNSNCISGRKFEKVDVKFFLTKEQQLKLLDLLQQSKSQHLPHHTNEVTKTHSGTYKTSQIQIFTIFSNLGETKSLLDTGATDHVCFSLDKFHTYKRMKPILVHLPNKQIVEAHIYETVLFTPCFFILPMYRSYHNFLAT